MSSTKIKARLEELKTLTVLVAAFIVLSWVFNIHHFVTVAFAILVIALFKNPLATLITNSWLRFAHILGAFNSKVILTISFYIVLVPLSIIYKAFNKKAVNHFYKKKEASYFEDVDRSYDKEFFEKTW